MIKTILNVPIYKIIIYLVLLILVALLIRHSDLLLRENSFFSKSNIEAFIQRTGVFSWIVYILLVAILSLSPFPGSAMGVIAGYLFNPFLAIIFTLTGESLGAMGNFFIGKGIIGNLLKQGKLPKTAILVNKYSRHLKPRTIFFLGIIPVGTANVTAYAAGLSGTKLKNYIIPWISGIGTLSVFTILLGHSENIRSPYLSIIIFIIVIGILILVKVFDKLIGINDKN